MNKWEYYVSYMETGFTCEDIETEINELGENGWELVSVCNASGGWIYNFKRPLVPTVVFQCKLKDEL